MGNRTELCPPSNEKGPQTFPLTQVNSHTSILEKSKGRQTWGYLQQRERSRLRGSPVSLYEAAPEDEQGGQEAAESTGEPDPPAGVCSTKAMLFVFAPRLLMCHSGTGELNDWCGLISDILHAPPYDGRHTVI